MRFVIALPIVPANRHTPHPGPLPVEGRGSRSAFVTFAIAARDKSKQD
jgi:hypothetical protein